MSILSGVSNFFRGLVGDSDEDRKKKQAQQQSAQRSSSAPTPGLVVQPNNDQSTVKVAPPPDNGVNLVVPAQPLQKASKTPAQQRAQATLDAMGGPANPNYQSKKVGVTDIAREAVKGIAKQVVDPAVHSFNDMQDKNMALRKASGPGVVNNLKATAAETGNFVKAIGQTGAEYAGYVAPEIKGLKAAAEAPKLVKAGAALLRHGATSAPLTVASDLAQGERDPLKIAGDAGLSTLVAGAVPGMTGLKKASPNGAEGAGVHSMNPNRGADQARAIADAAAKEAEKARVAAEAQLDTPAYKRQGQPEPAPQGPLDVPTFQRNNADELAKNAENRLNVIDTALSKVRPATQATRAADQAELSAAMVRSPDEGAQVLRKQMLKKAAGGNDPAAAAAGMAPLRDKAAQDLADAQAAQAARDALNPPPVSAEPVAGTPAAVTPEVPVDSPLVGAPAPIVGEAAPIQTSGEVSPGTPAPAAAPVLPEAPAQPGTGAVPNVEPGTATAPAAPDLRAAILKDMGEGAVVGKEAPGREALVLAELRAKAANSVRQVDPGQLADSYLVAADQLPALIRTPQDYALGRAALDVLYKLARDGDEAGKAKASAAASNIVDAMNLGASGSAQLMRVAQEAFNSMPIPMKISKVISRIKALNEAKFGADSPQADFSDPAKRNAVEARFDEVFQRDQDIREQIAGHDATLARGETEPGGITKEELQAAGKAKTILEDQLSLNSNRFAQIYEELTPGQGALDKAADFQRTAMLSAPTGRAGDVLTTGANVVHTAARQAVEGAAGRVLNTGRKLAGKAPGKYVDRGMSGRELVKAVPGALKKTYRDFKGTGDVGDISKLVKGQTGGTRSDIGGVSGNLGKRLVKAGVNFATHISEGVSNSEVLRLSRQEGLAKGLKGDDLDKFIIARQYTPSAAVAAKAKLAHETINNLNSNPITNAMRELGNIAEKHFKGPGKFIKNAILPFPTWVGGQMYNSITDKNVVANSIKVAIALKKGDSQAVVTQLTKAGLGVAELYGLGYLLSKQGVITDTDANGDKYEGGYLHVGDRYVPLTSLGFFAPNLLLGNAAYRAFEGDDSKDGSVVEKLAQASLNSISAYYKALSTGQLLGAENPLGKSFNNAFGGNNDAPEKAIDVVTSFGSQFVPTATRDVNAVLDNNTSLNPTREKSDTTALKPDGKKDYLGTALNKAKDLVPGVSQSLPRKADVAARDLVDRTLRGNRDTPGGVAAKEAAKTEADRTKDFKARNVPDPKGKNFDDAVKSRVENGEYDTAIEGLQAKLADNQTNKDIPKSKNKDIEDQIKTLKVTRDGKYDPAMIDTYKKTSLTEWRDMGDPESDHYDAVMYQKLFEYDSALAGQSVSRNATSQAEPFFSAKKPGKGRGGSAADKELSRIKSNTIGSTPNLGKVSLGDLAPQKAGSIKIPTIQQAKAGDLIKKRKITLGKA